MKLILSIFATCVFSLSQSQTITPDHKLHFGAGAVISGVSYAFFYTKTKSSKKAFWYSLATSSFAGLAKEVYDSGKKGNMFDTSEWVATTAGGLTVSTTLNLLTGKRKQKKQAEAKASFNY
jgi:uncharacterized protein YfiM (DUF2279 family)